MTTFDTTRREHLLSDTVAAVLAIASFGSSLRHVQTVASDHGQHGLISWGIAISVELVALVAILELRRSRGQQRVPIAAVVALTAGLAMSAGANLATATGHGFGWSQVVAVWPAVAYVLVAVIIETRPTASHHRVTRGSVDDTTALVSPTTTADLPTGKATRDDTAADAVGQPEPVRQPADTTVADHRESGPAATRLHAVPATSGTSGRASISADLLTEVLDGELTQAAAAERAGVSVRTLQRRLDAERVRRRESRATADGRPE